MTVKCLVRSGKGFLKLEKVAVLGGKSGHLIRLGGDLSERDARVFASLGTPTGTLCRSNFESELVTR